MAIKLVTNWNPMSHQPNGYHCPFCNIVSGSEDPSLILLRNESIIAVPSLHQQAGNLLSIIIFPIAHTENIYSLPEPIGASIFNATKKLAVALKRTFNCGGITIRQNNEPASGQDVWHYHVHVVPRFANDNYNLEPRVIMQASERIRYAGQIRANLTDQTM